MCIILVIDDPQLRDVLQQRLERDGHYVLKDSERPEGAYPRHLYCQLMTSKKDALGLIDQLQVEFAGVRVVVLR